MQVLDAPLGINKIKSKMKRIKEKIFLEKREEELEQYDYYDDEEIYKKWQLYSKSIGSFLISFSNLEYSLNQMVVKTFSDRADYDGIRIIKYLSFRDKLNFSNDQYKSMIHICINNKKTKTSELRKLQMIIDKLDEISVFRNKIAHANWTTLNKKGFVRVDFKESGVGGIVFQLIKITPAVINKFVRQADAIISRIDTFTDEIGSKF